MESGYIGCNVSFVTTREGIVLIDVPMVPTEAVKWRDQINKKGQVKYVINTEEHADHCQNSYFYGGTLITSQETREKMSKWKLEEVVERMKRLDPNWVPHMKSFEVRLADIAFTGIMNYYLGDHTFKLFPLVGHTTGGIGVYIPEEKVAFATDCVFHHFKTWLPEAIPDEWLKSLEKLDNLDIDTIVPGHGDVCKKDYLREQASIVAEWVDVIRSAIKKGMSEEEAINKISIPDPYPNQPNTPNSETEINKKIISHLYQLYVK